MNRFYYCLRFAFGVTFPIAAWEAMESVGWSFKYIYTDPVIRYICIQNRKQDKSISHLNPSNTEHLTLLVHTSITFIDDMVHEG